MSPKRNDLDFWVRKNMPCCDYCLHSTEDIPDREEQWRGRLWCIKHQKIVMGTDKACADYEC